MPAETRPAGGDVIDAYLTPEIEEFAEMETESDVRPMRWTSDGHLHTDPHGFEPVDVDADVQVADQSPEQQTSETRSPAVWLKKRRAEVSQQLSEITNPRVTKAEAKLAEAEALEAVDNDDRSIARANRTAKKWSMIALLGSIAAGLLISSSTAQQTIASTLGWTGGLGYWLAYLADPAIGVPLFAMLGVTSLATQRGVQLPPEAHAAFKRCEVALFVLVALLNGGPAVAAALRSLVVLFGASDATLRVMDTAGHGFVYAVIHLIGPVLVGTVIWALPHVSGALALISAGPQSTPPSSTPNRPVASAATSTPNRPADPAVWYATSDDDSTTPTPPVRTARHGVEELGAFVADAVRSGRLPAGRTGGVPGVDAIGAFLRREGRTFANGDRSAIKAAAEERFAVNS